MRRFLYFLIVVLLVIGGCASSLEGETVVSQEQEGGLQWIRLPAGISWVEARPSFEGEEKNFLLVRVDPRQFQFSIYQNDSQEKAEMIEDVHKKLQAVLSFNGAFFGKDFRPIAFLKSEKKVLHKVSQAELVDGIFVITEAGKASLVGTKNFQDRPDITFALQNGPVLLDQNAKIPVAKDFGKPAARTAMGIDKNGQIIIIILKQSLFDSDNTLSLYEFAQVLKEDPLFHDLGLHSVLNLDGGPSTGLMFDGKYYPEMNTVQNMVIVKPLKNK